MAAAVIESSAGGGAAGASSLSILKPTGTAEGDLLVAVLVQDDERAGAATLSGWTTVANVPGGSAGINARTDVLAKEAGASEPSFYTFSGDGGSDDWGGVILRISGADTDPANIDSATDDAAEDSGTSINIPGITTAEDDALVLRIIGSNDVNSGAVPGSTLTGHTLEIQDGEPGDDATATVFWKEVASAGSVSSETNTASNNIDATSVTLAIYPPASAPVVVTPSPVSASWSDPGAGTSLSHSVAPESATWSAQQPATGQAVAPAPESATWASVQPAIAIATELAPVSVTWTDVATGLVIATTVSPAAGSWSAVTPAAGPVIAVTPDPVTAALAAVAPLTDIVVPNVGDFMSIWWSAVTPAVAKEFIQRPIPLEISWDTTLAITSLTHTVGVAAAGWLAVEPSASTAATVSPEPKSASWSEPGAATAIDTTVSPASVSLAAVAPASKLSTAASPAGAAWSAIAATITLIASLTPAAAAWSDAAPSTAHATSLDPVATTWAAAAPTTALVATPAPAGATWTAIAAAPDIFVPSAPAYATMFGAAWTHAALAGASFERTELVRREVGIHTSLEVAGWGYSELNAAGPTETGLDERTL